MNTTIDNSPKMTQEDFNKITSQINIEELYKQNATKIVEEQLRNVANEVAAREPLPSMVETALSGEKIIVKTSVGDVQVRKMVAVDITIFKKTESPFYKLLMGEIGEGESSAIKQLFPDEELLYEVIYQFTHPVKAVYQLVKGSKDAYHAVVVEDMINKGYSPADMVELVQRILEYIGLVNKAQVEFSVKEDDAKKK